MIAKARLYLTLDRKRIVPANSKEAAYLFAAPGQEIPDDLAKRYGLTDEAPPAPSPSPVAEERETRVLTPTKRGPGRPRQHDSGSTGSR